MAILKPTLEIIKKQKVQPTDGEWALLSFLIENLDNTYEIYYQPYLNGDNPDIVILKKNSGVLIIEVKDWNLEYYIVDKKTNWRLKKDNTYIKSPLKQVNQYKDNIFDLHSEEFFIRKLKNKSNFAVINCVVYFHNATRKELYQFLLKNFQDDEYQKYRKFVSYFDFFCKDSLNTNKLYQMLSKFRLDRYSKLFDDILYKSIRRYLKPPFHSLEEGKEIYYTKEQKILTLSEERPRRKIKGVAGCGKTLVLAKRAVNAHIRTGSRVLILTFNLSLKNYIHDRVSDVRENFYWSNFYITNYHQFFKVQANNYNLKFELGDWEDENFFERVRDDIKKFDVILIDEIQDYRQEWINIITKYFIYDSTEFIVFGDEKQNIYQREMDENKEPIVKTIPGKWNKTLNICHRSTTEIGGIAIDFQKKFFVQKYNIDNVLFQQSEMDFERRIIEYHFFDDIDLHKINDVLFEMLIKNEIHSSDLGVLSSKIDIIRELDYIIRTKKKEKTTTTFEKKEFYEKYKNDEEKIKVARRFKKNHFWMKTGTIKLSTIHSFKGWEIDTLLLIIEQASANEDSNNDELIYTSLTRAKRNLIIFNLGNNRYDDFFNSKIQNKFQHSKPMA